MAAHLIWDSNGCIKVADLGLAALTVDKEDQEFQTVHDIVAGTPDFMAPEQANSLGNASPASDVYSLAATWFFILRQLVEINLPA